MNTNDEIKKLTQLLLEARLIATSLRINTKSFLDSIDESNEGLHYDISHDLENIGQVEALVSKAWADAVNFYQTADIACLEQYLEEGI